MSNPGATISFRVTDDGVKLGLQKIAGKLPQVTRETLDEIMEQAKFEASGGYSGGNSYTVPTVYGQVYERTGNLGRSVRYLREGLTYRMINDAVSKTGQPYGVKVLGAADGSGQGRDFVGRWPNFAATMRKWADIAVERMHSVLDTLTGDFGL